MAILVTCTCGKRFQANDTQAGKVVRCPDCQQGLRVPSASANVQSEAPAKAPRRRRFEDDEAEVEPRPAADQASTSGKALFSLLLGIASFCIPVFLLSFVAILLGFLGVRDVNRSEGRLKGKGMAIGGIITGFLSILSSLIVLAVGGLGYFFYTIGSEKMETDGATSKHYESRNNLKLIGVGMHSYESTHRQFPPAVVCDEQGKPLYSWRVLLLPYINEQNLANQFHYDEPWDSPHNRTLLGQMPKVYAAPGNPPTPEPNSTFYQVFDGPFQESPGPMWRSGLNDLKGPPPSQAKFPIGQPGRTAGPKQVFGKGRAVRVASVVDGTSNTFMVVEAGDAVPWTKPADIPYRAGQPLPKLGGVFKGGFNACMADGSTRFIRKTTPESTIRILITCDDGMVVPFDF